MIRKMLNWFTGETLSEDYFQSSFVADQAGIKPGILIVFYASVLCFLSRQSKSMTVRKPKRVLAFDTAFCVQSLTQWWQNFRHVLVLNGDTFRPLGIKRVFVTF